MFNNYSIILLKKTNAKINLRQAAICENYLGRNNDNIVVNLWLIDCSKSKEELEQISGKIEFIVDKYMNLPSRNFGKYRFIKIDSEIKPFEIFIGKETGDFKPDMEKIYQLKPEDTVVLYLNSLGNGEEAIVKRSIEIIEHNNKPYFISGNSKVWLIAFLLITGIGIAILAMVYKHLGKII